MTREVELRDPNAGISSVHFNPYNNNLLAVTTWTGFLEIHDIGSNVTMAVKEFPVPLTCSTWITPDVVAVGGINGGIFTSNDIVVEAHEAGISSIFMIPGSQLTVTTSWDQTIKIWNLQGALEPVHTFDLNDRILCAEPSTNGRIIAHGAKNFVYIIDISNPENIERRVSSLGHQIRSACASTPTDFGWAIGSIDGRIAIEYFGDELRQAQRFAFSCNRRDEEERVIVYPVNALAFHPQTGVLTSGSCNGDLCFWDIDSKRKLAEIPSPFGVSIACMDYNNDGSILAIAFSYTWDKGDIEHGEDKLILHAPSPASVTPKEESTIRT